jgi:hypothetical protein
MPDLVIHVQVIERPRRDRRPRLLQRFGWRLHRLFRADR